MSKRRLERPAAGGHRPRLISVVVLFTVLALGMGILGLGHDHAGEETLGEHDCFAFHSKPLSIVSAGTEVGAPFWVPLGRAPVQVTRYSHDVSGRSLPPFRGPPS